MSSKAVIAIKNSNQVVIKIRINYSEAADIFRKHDKIFLRGLNRKEASYAHKRLEVLCKCKVEAHPAFLVESNEEGYYFEKES